jgi:hypothetical protein
VQVVLAPGGIELTRLGRGLRPGGAQKAVVPVEAGTTWNNVIAALDEAFADPRWRKAEADVLLSSHFVRVHLLPWSESLATDAERLAYAVADLEAVHGERVRDWTLVVDDAPPGAAAPVCAVDTALLEALRASCRQATLRIRSVRPHFAAVLEDNRGRLRGRHCGFVFAEAGRLALALYESDACRWLANPRVGVALAEALAAEVRQAEALGYAGENGRLHVAFAGPVEALPARVAGWEIVPVASAAGPRRPALVDARLVAGP